MWNTILFALPRLLPVISFLILLCLLHFLSSLLSFLSFFLPSFCCLFSPSSPLPFIPLLLFLSFFLSSHSPHYGYFIHPINIPPLSLITSTLNQSHLYSQTHPLISIHLYFVPEYHSLSLSLSRLLLSFISLLHFYSSSIFSSSASTTTATSPFAIHPPHPPPRSIHSFHTYTHTHPDNLPPLPFQRLLFSGNARNTRLHRQRSRLFSPSPPALCSSSLSLGPGTR